MEKKKETNSKIIMWCLLVLLPPVGLIYLWTARRNAESDKTKKTLSIIFGIWTVIFIVAGSAGSKDSSEKTDVIKDTNIVAEESEDKDTSSDIAESETVESTELNTEKELTTEEKIKEVIENIVGEENLITFNYVPDNEFSLIKFTGSENLSTSMTVKGMYIDIFNLIKAIQPIIDTNVDFNVVYPLVDKYGNSDDVIVIKATYNLETIKKINFDNALWENTPEIADEWWAHPALNSN